MLSKLKTFFGIDGQTTIQTEVIAGITTFLSMAYILAVNTFMLAETGMPAGSVFLATAISAAIATLIMGLYAKYPVALAPGMGVNAFFTYTVVLFGFGYTWEQALAAVFVSGIIFIIISFTGLRKAIINAIPIGLKYAVGAGIGLFIAFIGFKNAGIIVANPATLVSLGAFTPAVLLALFGITITFILYIRGVKGAIFIGMVITAISGLILNGMGVEGMPTYVAGGFDDLTLKPTFFKALSHIGDVVTTKDGWIIIFTFLFIDFFDTAGTLMAVGQQAGLIDDKGELVDGHKALAADSIGTTVGALLGTSTVTSYIESATGIGSGGRTGLTAVVVAILFLLAIPFYPILSVVTAAVTAPALVVVGVLMFGALRNLDWNDLPLIAAAFLTMILMLLTFSISIGIAAGFLFYTIFMVAAKRWNEVHWIMYILSLLFILHFYLL